MTNNERPKRRKKLMTRFGNPISSSLPNLIHHTEVVRVPEWKENKNIFLMSRREELERWNLFKMIELVSNHVAGDLGKRIMRTRWLDTRKVATDGTNENKSRLAVQGDREEKNLLLQLHQKQPVILYCALSSHTARNQWRFTSKRLSCNHEDWNGMSMYNHQSKR